MYLVPVFLAFFVCCYAADEQNDDVVLLEPAEGGYIFEGDMIMSKENIKHALHGTTPNENAFGLQKSTYYRWKDGVVPYTLDPSFAGSSLRINSLKKAMKAWEDKTCVRFVERTNQNDYINVFSAGFGKCYSFVGKTGGKQRLSLGWGCFGVGVAIHELGHALGLHHEQSRPDRDDYVYIKWGNIIEDNKHNFKKYDHSIDSRGSPYDYDSIMHYEWNAFSKYLVGRTIGANNGASIGQRSHVSVQDAWQINKYYECKKSL